MTNPNPEQPRLIDGDFWDEKLTYAGLAIGFAVGLAVAGMIVIVCK